MGIEFLNWYNIFPICQDLKHWDFPGGPVVKTSLPNAGGAGSIQGQGVKIPRLSTKKTKKHKTDSIKNLKMG